VSRVSKEATAEIEQRLAAIEHAKGSVAHLAPDRNLADELIKDRRAEVRSQEARRASESPDEED